MTTRAEVAATLVTALRAMNLAGGVHRRKFRQAAGAPEWPAIRYTFIDTVPTVDICGDGGEETADYRVQIDLVASDKTGDSAFEAQCSQLKAAIAALGPTWVLDSEGDDEDEETKTIRLRVDYLVYLSTPE